MSETLTYDNLFAGSVPAAVTEVVTLLRGSGTLARGTVLGKILHGAATSAVGGPGVAGANTGTGTLTMDATTPKLADVQVGVYKVRVIRKALAQVGTTPAVPAQKALVELKDPSGNVLEVFDLATSSGTTVVNQIKFAMVEGSTVFEVGDGFNITVAAGSGYCVAVDSTALNGANVPYGILCEDVALASGAETLSVAYMTGMFNEDALDFGGSDTKDTHRAAMRNLNMYMKTTVPVA